MNLQAESIGFWTLPEPEKIEDTSQWLPIPRISRTIPFGYVVDENDPDVLQPVKLELDLLEQARKYIKQYSYRQVANWLSKNSGRDISHVGLMKRLKNERQRQNQALSLRRWADYAQKAIQKAQKIEDSRTGAKHEAESSPA